MKTLIIAIKLMFIPLIVVGQNYRQQMDFISSKDSVTKIDWILRSPKNCTINLDHYITFLDNTNSNKNHNSKVLIEIFHNEKLVENYVPFNVGEEYKNHIVLNDLKLKKGDNVYFKLSLKYYQKDEEYVFNIYQDKGQYSPNNKKDMVASTITYSKKASTPKKSKSIKNNGIDRNFRRMQRRPIENENQHQDQGF